MKVNGKEYRTIWMEGASVMMIDQNRIPFEFFVFRSENFLTTCDSIRNMTTRGAGAIGAAAGFAMAQAFLAAPVKNRDKFLLQAKETIINTRPTARNLFYAVDLVYEAGLISPKAAYEQAQQIAEKDIADSRAIGKFGSMLINNGDHILTHCNAGWLAFVDYGTALAPIYRSVEDGNPCRKGWLCSKIDFAKKTQRKDYSRNGFACQVCSYVERGWRQILRIDSALKKLCYFFLFWFDYSLFSNDSGYKFGWSNIKRRIDCLRAWRGNAYSVNFS
jgi:hypothetical protein